MLGWQVYVRQESNTLVASWCVGIGGLDWLDELVKKNLAKDLGGNGYPCRYSAKAEVVLPYIIPTPPPIHNSKLTLGDDYILDNKECWEIRFNVETATNCKLSEVLTIEAWDLS